MVLISEVQIGTYSLSLICTALLACMVVPCLAWLQLGCASSVPPGCHSVVVMSSSGHNSETVPAPARCRQSLLRHSYIVTAVIVPLTLIQSDLD